MAGFYKKDGDSLIEASKAVYNKNYELLIEKKDTYNYPVDGWKYFDTREAAVLEYGIVEEKKEEVK
jgi:hypothetical protein